ncbi:MAG: porin [Rhodobacteraceae bacterium]|nr:porin [Paracoccaceae bacterium]
MKKLLLASTALVGMAGAAAAEMSLSGYAEIGIKGGDYAGGNTQFHNDVVVNFNFSGETDNGLSFGGKVQLDDTNGSGAINGAPTFDDEAFWVSGTFGKVTLGETDGAFDWALSEIYSGTAITDDHSTHAGAYWFTGLDGTQDNQIMRYEYSFGDVGVALSVEQDTNGAGSDDIWAVGLKWSGDLGGTAVNVGLGFQDNGTTDVAGISFGATLAGGFGINLGYASGDLTPSGYGTANDDWIGIGVSYTSGPLLLGANYGEYDSGNDGWGVVVNYDLGGGAVAMAGYGDGTLGNSWSMGLGLSF